MKAIDLVGHRFGMLLVTHKEGRNPVMWACACDCGNKSSVKTGALRSGNTKSCGCRKAAVLGESTTRHGGASTKTYRHWKSMVQRCTNENNRQFSDYGGRGIKVCVRWRDYAKFLKDMGPAPEGMTLDRRNNNKGYTPGNCRWATRMEQNQNARSNIRVVIAGESRVAADWGRVYGIRKATIYARIKRGWDPQKACTTPPRRTKKKAPTGSGG